MSQPDASDAVEDYLDALVAKDSNRVSSLVCPEWETGALAEVDSLEAVSPSLKEMSCQISGESEAYTLVNCTGTMELSYNGEIRELTLSRRTYQVVQDRGDWLVCGYEQ